jgi:phosphatidylserine/phosphatidylglycerophosphate/cardiolipin synthase-like enzyme
MLAGKFHNKKQKLNMNNKFDIQDCTLEIYFSPKDKQSNQIINYISHAEEYIYVPALLITHSKIVTELINAHRRGVDVKIILDANSTSTKHIKYNTLRNSGIPLKMENFAGKLHTKTMIIDDKYLITGSMNFSNSGENYNDENTIIITNDKFAKFYKNFFMYLWTVIPDKYLKYNPPAESKESLGSCFDGVDNNFNGKIDFQEPLCK